MATGTAPSGLAYELSHIDASDVGADPAESFCTQDRTSAAAARGCEYVGARPVRPSFSLLGTDRFFSIIAPEGVAAMEVRVEGQVEGQTEAARSRSFDAGAAGRLLFVMVGGPMVTSRDPASSQEYEVRLLDADGNTVHELAAGDSGGP